MEELCDGLSRQTAGLKVLLLRNNQITASGMVHLAKALVRDIKPAVSPTDTITTLFFTFDVKERLQVVVNNDNSCKREH